MRSLLGWLLEWVSFTALASWLSLGLVGLLLIGLGLAEGDSSVMGLGTGLLALAGAGWGWEQR